MKIKDYLKSITFKDILMVLLVICLAAQVIYQQTHPKIETKEKIVEKVKTITVKEPVPVNTYITKPILIPLETEKLVVKNDTTYIVLEKEVKEFRDSLYYCRISGYQPKLEQLDIYQKTIEHTKEITKYKRPLVSFGVGVSAGYSPIYKNVDVIAGVNITIPLYSIYIR